MFDLKIKNLQTGTYYPPSINSKFLELIDQGFVSIFYYEYECRLVDDLRVIDYNFYLKNSILKKPMITISCTEDDTIIKHSCEYCQSDSFCLHIKAAVLTYESLNIIKNVKNNDEKEKFDQLFIKLEEENKQKIIQFRREKALKEADNVLSKIEKNDILPLADLLHLDCILEVESGLHLYLKIGIDKMYVVSNIPRFSDAVSQSLEMHYGKNVFCLAIDNFKKEQHKLIEFIKHASITNRFLNNNYLEIDQSHTKVYIDEFFNTVKGLTIYIKKETVEIPYYVSLEPVEVRLVLTEDYELKLNTDDLIINGYHHDYLLRGNQIYLIDYEDKSLRVMVKELSKQSQSYEYIKEVFRDKIYPRLSKYIDVPDNLRDELQLVDYKIEGYFDLEDEVLTVDTKYFCDGVEVTADKLSSISYKLTKYNHFLTNLGFNDEGKITEMTKVMNFLRSDLSELRVVAEVFLSENIKKMELKVYRKTSSYLSYNTGMLEICFEKSEYSDEELNKIIKSLRKKVKYIKLNKNTIIEVDEAAATKLLNTVDEFNLDINNLTSPQLIPLYHSLKLSSEDLDIVDYKITDNLKSLLKELANYKKADFEIPSHLVEVMRPYQKEAFLWMKTLVKYNFCGILADDMGLGKTLEVISVLLTDETNLPILVVCPKSLCYNWKNEFALWAKDIEVINIIGNATERKNIIKNIDKEKRVVYISSYDSLRMDIDYYEGIKFQYLILDEAQSIKNHDTLKAKSVKLIESNIRFVLTGTPIENTIIDLWSIFDFLMPNYLGTHGNFKSKYERAIVERKDEDLIDRLVKKITPFVLRREKKDVLKDLPSKIEFIRMASMSSTQKKLYDAQLKRVREILTTDKDNKILILSMLTRLRQVCVDPELFVEDYDGESCKLDLLSEILDEYLPDGHKVVIFSQFVSVFDKIQKMITEKGYKYFTLTGKTQAIDRVNMAESFNKNDDEKVFLVSLKAGGTGLNLVGADVVIHLDPWWNYAVENQATDRTHRIGQKKIVSVIKLVVENSIEQKVIELQNIKKEIAERIISSDPSNIDKIRIDDIKYLLE